MRNRFAIVYISALLVLLAAVLFWMTRPPRDLQVHTEHSVPRAEIMTGRDDPRIPHVEFLPGERININTAGEAELQRLPGIGQERAQAIIAWRETHGSFSACRELLDLPEITDAVYAQIENRITLE